jgi:oligopeptidase B
MQKIDKYSWLRDKNWPKIEDKAILKVLDEEAKLAEDFFQDKEVLLEELFQEIKAKVPLEDFSVPYLDKGYYYYAFIRAGDQYWKYARRKATPEITKETIMAEIFQAAGEKDVFLDEELLAKDEKYFDLCHYEISPCGKFIGYALDCLGDQRYKIIVEELETKKILAQIDNTMGEFLWHEKEFGLFYVPANEFWRADKVYYKNLTSQEEPQEIYFEKDYTFHLSIRKSEDKNYLIITAQSYESTEVTLINWAGETKVFLGRDLGLEVKISPWQDLFFKLTNDLGDNKRLVKRSQSGEEEEVIALSNKALINFYLKKDYLILEARNEEALPDFTLYKIEATGFLTKIETLKFNEKSYHVNYLETPFELEECYFKFSSLKESKIIYSYNLQERSFQEVRRVILPDFDPELYEIKYEMVKVPGTYFQEEVTEANPFLQEEVEVPVTIFYKKGLKGPKPTLLYGYGSYGIVNSSHFRPSIIPLLDRGFLFAIGHIRGGGERGKAWHEAGKKLYKKNTFEDCIRVGQALKDQNYSSELAILGESAGGLLVGYCINRVPELYKTALLIVPFVDVLNTMLDDTLPLTPGEFKEWGNPITDKVSYDYIASYSPYDNLDPQKNYPDLYVASGLQDPRVTYWEPLKFVKKLRDFPSHNKLLLKMEDTGHDGASGRFDSLKEVAKSLVFLLKSIS